MKISSLFLTLIIATIAYGVGTLAKDAASNQAQAAPVEQLPATPAVQPDADVGQVPPPTVGQLAVYTRVRSTGAGCANGQCGVPTFRYAKPSTIEREKSVKKSLTVTELAPVAAPTAGRKHRVKRIGRGGMRVAVAPLCMLRRQ